MWLCANALDRSVLLEGTKRPFVMSEAPSAASESAPPSPAGRVHDAGEISNHPLWQRSAGVGKHPPYPSNNGKRPGKERSKDNPMQDSPNPSRMCPISMLELEIRSRNVLDGASSVASDVGDEYEEADATHPGPSSSRKRSRVQHEEEGSDTSGDEDEDDQQKKKSSKGASSSNNQRSMIVRAAFGGTAGMTSGIDDAANSETADNSSVVSGTRRESQFGPARAFPVTGISCVGCALPQRIGPVDEFVHASCSKMQEMALFKLAALVYIEQVVKPAQAEGIVSPSWSWKDVRSHYTLHCVDVRMQRYENLRVLAAMRKTMELNLLREDPETGEQTLDKSNSAQILQIMDRQNKILDLVGTDAGGKGVRKPAAPA